MNAFGLIGKTLKHSFSENYFNSKFEKEGIEGNEYKLYELSSIDQLPDLVKSKQLKGLNVTIPYKRDVLPFVDILDESAKKVGAVNVLKFTDKWIGYNSDYYGFLHSLNQWITDTTSIKALVLGSGGASMAIRAVLDHLGIQHLVVSRTKGDLSYPELKERGLLLDHFLVINCTPLGTYPNIDNIPQIDYSQVGSHHFFYDLVYNPEQTLFMKEAERKGAKTKNGLEMLALQAEKSWEIWNKEEYGI